MTSTETDRSVATIDVAETALRDGDPVLALDRFAVAHAADPTDPRLFEGAFRALEAAAATPGSPALAGREGVADLLRAMILQEPGPDRPRTLHRAIGTKLRRPDAETVRPIMAALMPVIDELLDTPAPATGVALLLAVARGMMPRSGPSQKRISRLHIAQFANFASSDLWSPYAVMFFRKRFGANRDDLLQRYPTPQAALAPEAGLSLRHLLLLDQLGLGPLFAGDDEDALAETLAQRLAAASPGPHDVRVARSLVLRYFRRGDGPAAQRLLGLGLAPELLETAARWPRFDRAPVAVRPLLDGTVRRYLASGLNAAVIAAPALALLRRKARIALCVSGQLRGFERAFATWQRALLPFADFDIYVHTWARVGRAVPNSGRPALPFAGAAFCAEWRRISRREGRKAMKARQPHLFAALDADNFIDAGRVQAICGAVDVVVEDETDPRFESFSNQDKMHYKIHAAHTLAERSGRSYDLVMRLRPDMAMRLPGFRWSRLRKLCEANPVVFADLGFGVNGDWLMIGDMMAIGAPETMKTYASAWETNGAVGKLDVFGVPPQFVGHIALAQSCWYAGIDVQLLPFSRGGLLDLAPISTSQIQSALAKDAEHRHDAIDQALAAAVSIDRAAAREG